MIAVAWQCFLVTFSYIGCAVDPCWGWALLMPVAHMHCLHVSSVVGSLRWQSCGHATGLCSGVCLETLATETGVHDRHWSESRKSWWLSGFVRQNRTFPPLIRIQKCWLFAHQNMQKPLYIHVIDQNIDSIYLCSWCRSTVGVLQLWWKIRGRLEWPVGLTRWNSRSYCLVAMFNLEIIATGCHTTAMKAFCCLQREHAKNHVPLVAFGSWLRGSWRRSRSMKAFCCLLWTYHANQYKLITSTSCTPAQTLYRMPNRMPNSLMLAMFN